VKTARGLHDEISKDLTEIGNELDSMAGRIDCAPPDRNQFRQIRGKVSALCELLNADIPAVAEISKTIFSIEIRQLISEINVIVDKLKDDSSVLNQLKELLAFPKFFLTQSNEAMKKFEPLTKREKEVLILLPRGLTAKAMASELFLTEATIKSHLASIFRKFEVVNRTQAIAIAIEIKVLTF
jgi:ATP/maltotriose-dependent transcriptional regulator MalT